MSLVTRLSSLVTRLSLVAVSAATLSLCALVAPVQADTTFDTTPQWNGTDGTRSWGRTGLATIGQTFIAPTDNVLQDFTFYLLGPSSVNLSYKAVIFEWSGPITGAGGQATGSALFTSSSRNFIGDDTFQPITTSTGGTVLVTGKQYVALLTVSDPTDFAKSTGRTLIGISSFDTHVPNNGGGGFVFNGNLSTFNDLNTKPWGTNRDIGDMVWKANFTGATVVPEPSEIVTGLMLFGSVGLCILRARRKS